MKPTVRTLPLALVLLAGCGGAGPSSRSASPIVTGDACALHQDAAACRADAQGCVWYDDTRPCFAGELPCPAGWCSAPPSNDGGAGDGGAAASAACACPGAGGEACLMEMGGPAVQVAPPITCASIPASCALPDRCGCLSTAALGTCASSGRVANLCVCDNGVR